MTPLDAAALVQPARLHRDIYLSPEVFALERQHLWAAAWLFVGHDSQVPRPGDFITTDLAGQPVLMIRQADGGVGVLLNRCAHKGAPVATAQAGHFDRYLRCPYHGWTYRLDGTLAGIPVKAGYEGSGFEGCPASSGLVAYGEVAVHRGFVFARTARRDGAAGFAESMGELLGALDLLADRSPSGRLQVAGGVLRTEFRANWKIYFENINDAFHPITTHASVSEAAAAVWGTPPPGTAVPLAMRQLLPFTAGYAFFEQMGARLLPHGHSVLGTRHSIHTGYADLGDYGAALRAAHGEQRAQQVLAFAPQNVVFYPGMALKGAPQVMRVLRPLAHDRTVLEAWAFQPEGAPLELLQSALLYNRQVFSPMSMLAHDDLHLFERIQLSLAAGGPSGNPWVSQHRGAAGDADATLPREVSGIDEALLRNQYRAWREAMLAAAEATA
ncbi:MAG: Rieske 2Fe-2S domain-containing protein [Rubrivivax sp.]|nr:Rieske 2Fe-2S domain-containing protein [Rubrivivax sp.]